MTVRDIDREAEEFANKLYPVTTNRPALSTAENFDVRQQARKQIADTYKAGYDSGQKSKWLAYPENKPPLGKKILIQIQQVWYEAYCDDGQYGIRFLDGRGGTFYNVERWMSVELPDQSVSKEGE